MALIDVRVPDIGDFDEVAVISFQLYQKSFVFIHFHQKLYHADILSENVSESFFFRNEIKY